MRRNDPRIRQTLNQISQNLESANLTTQASLFNFSQVYLSPCLSSLQSCLEASCQPCFTARDEQRRPHHRNARRGGREDLGFDFYDNWEEDEGEWGNDELDRLLAGSEEQPPGKHRGMSYGSQGVRRKSLGMPNDAGMDPTVMPTSSMFGFLQRLPWKFGSREIRYRPSAADLQEHVGKRREQTEPLMEDSDESGAEATGRRGRTRSGTTGSGSTTNSLSSRGDLFPSEDEDDAIPLDDEFAMVLERRITTGTTTSDDLSSRKGRKSTGKKRPKGSRASTKTASSRDTKSTGKNGRATSAPSVKAPSANETATEVPSMTDLKHEEELVQREEEAEIKGRRVAAQQLALQRGLGNTANEPSAAQKSQGDVKAGQQEQANDDPADEDISSIAANPNPHPADPTGPSHAPTTTVSSSELKPPHGRI